MLKGNYGFHHRPKAELRDREYKTTDARVISPRTLRARKVAVAMTCWVSWAGREGRQATKRAAPGAAGSALFLAAPLLSQQTERERSLHPSAEPWSSAAFVSIQRFSARMRASSALRFSLPAREMLFACLSVIMDVVLRSPVCAETQTRCCNDKRLYFNFTVCHHCLSVAILLIPPCSLSLTHMRTHAKVQK